MSATSVKVAVRVRPMAAKELLANSSDCVSYVPGTPQIIVGSNSVDTSLYTNLYAITQKSFTFDYVFDPMSSQNQVYDDSIGPLVERFLEGFNATILAYGQTGSGKTYSMGIGLDGLNAASCDEQQGIVPRAITAVFDRLAQLSSLLGSRFRYSMSVSFLELYNEELVDLLNPRPRTALGGPSIREDASGKIIWINVKEEEVKSPQDLLAVLQRGTLCRTTGSTDMNASSSRSHAIFSISLRQEKTTDSDSAPASPSSLLPNSGGSVRETILSKFHFVDLAGSERLKRTNAEGDRKKEGISINQGLLALGNVISALGDESRRSLHVPYRDSKLTRMLQDSLGGNSQTLMLACVSPSDLNYNETVNTLHYANRARNIKNRVVINQEWMTGAGGAQAFDKEIKTLRGTVAQLRTELAMMKSGNQIASTELVLQGGSSQEIQFYQRRERDLMADVEMYKTSQTGMRFSVDQLTFKSNRLKLRVRELLNELVEKTAERDSALVQKALALKSNLDGKSQALVLASSVNGINGTDPIVTDIQDLEEPEAPVTLPSEGRMIDIAHIHPLIQDYIAEISTLRFRLSEMQDKLAWHVEAMTSFGRKKPNKKQAWASPNSKNGRDMDIGSSDDEKDEAEEDAEFGVLSRPAHKRLFALQKEMENSAKTDETTFLKTLKENPNLSTVLNGSEKSGDITKTFELMAGESRTMMLETPILESLPVQEDPNGTDPDMFILINKLQTDIAQHEALVERIQKRDSEYEVMKKAYEQKLNVLQRQVSQIQQERDLAIKKMQEASSFTVGGIGRKARITAANTKYDEEKQKLDSQIAEYRRKLGDNSKLQNSNRSRMDHLTRELQATIDALKAEKSRMLKDLRKEAQKNRDISNASAKEISRLRKRERAAADAAKRLEKTNEVTKRMLKKRSDEVTKSRGKLQTVMNLLRRSSTPNRVFKTVATISSPGSKRNTRPGTAVGARAASARLSGNTYFPRGSKVGGSPALGRLISGSSNQVADFLNGIRSPMKFSNNSLPPSGGNHSFAIKVALRKSTIDLEIESTLVATRIEKSLEIRKAKRYRLMGEHSELMGERERVVQSEFERSGLFDPDAPQYMDERLAVIDSEIRTIDNEMEGLEDSLRRHSDKRRAADLFKELELDEDENIWSNVTDIVHALNREELEYLLVQYLKSIVDLRLVLEETDEASREKDNALADWRKMAEVFRASQMAASPGSVNAGSPTRSIGALIPRRSLDPLPPRPSAPPVQPVRDLLLDPSEESGIVRSTSMPAVVPNDSPRSLLPKLSSSPKKDDESRLRIPFAKLFGRSDESKSNRGRSLSPFRQPPEEPVSEHLRLKIPSIGSPFEKPEKQDETIAQLEHDAEDIGVASRTRSRKPTVSSLDPLREPHRDPLKKLSLSPSRKPLPKPIESPPPLLESGQDVGTRINILRRRYGYDGPLLPPNSKDSDLLQMQQQLNAMTAPRDVFERLSTAHTLASQAKVIQRVNVDKDALLSDINPTIAPTEEPL